MSDAKQPKKSPPERALAMLKKSGWHTIVILGVDERGRMRACTEDGTPPIHIVGLMECMKLATVRTLPEHEEGTEAP